ncbi:hypothetical protein ABZ512_12625 [Nocardiopsis dassonvillei]|uniref:hypothetical protein n=1 Tax=Nocardiopsis dassonvillei TaxID=2014 RepID=UPI0033EBF713
MATPRTTAVALVAAALTLIATACSGGDPAEAPRVPGACLDHRTDPPEGSPPTDLAPEIPVEVLDPPVADAR